MKKSWTCQTQISNIRLFLVPHESPQKVLLNFIHFTTIDKSNYTTLVMLSPVVGTGVRTKGSLMSLMWKEAGVPGENPRIRAGDHHTLSHTTTVEYGNRTLHMIAAQWKARVHVLSSALLGQSTFYCLSIIHLNLDLYDNSIISFSFKSKIK